MGHPRIVAGTEEESQTCPNRLSFATSFFALDQGTTSVVPLRAKMVRLFRRLKGTAFRPSVITAKQVRL
jgi:hypothetical protein